MSKIKLKFQIDSYWDSDQGRIFTRYKKTIEFEDSCTFGDVLLYIYKNYSIDEFSDVDSDDYSIVNTTFDLFSIEYKFKGLELERENINYDNVPLYLLDKQFSISKHRICLMLDPGIGDYVGQYRGLHFFFHKNEKEIHHKPHIHCKYGDEELRIDIVNNIILDKPFKNNKYNKIALKCVAANRKSFLNYWNRSVVNGESIKFRMYIPF